MLSLDFVRHITEQYGVSHSGSCFVHHGRNTCRISLKCRAYKEILNRLEHDYSLKRRLVRLTSRTSCEQSSEPRENSGLVPRPMHALPVAWERDCAIRNLNMGIELGLGMWVE